MANNVGASRLYAVLAALAPVGSKPCKDGKGLDSPPTSVSCSSSFSAATVAFSTSPVGSKNSSSSSSSISRVTFSCSSNWSTPGIVGSSISAVGSSVGMLDVSSSNSFPTAFITSIGAKPWAINSM